MLGTPHACLVLPCMLVLPHARVFFIALPPTRSLSYHSRATHVPNGPSAGSLLRRSMFCVFFCSALIASGGAVVLNRNRATGSITFLSTCCLVSSLHTVRPAADVMAADLMLHTVKPSRNFATETNKPIAAPSRLHSTTQPNKNQRRRPPGSRKW